MYKLVTAQNYYGDGDTLMIPIPCMIIMLYSH